MNSLYPQVQVVNINSWLDRSNLESPEHQFLQDLIHTYERSEYNGDEEVLKDMLGIYKFRLIATLLSITNLEAFIKKNELRPSISNMQTLIWATREKVVIVEKMKQATKLH